LGQLPTDHEDASSGGVHHTTDHAAHEHGAEDPRIRERASTTPPAGPESMIGAFHRFRKEAQAQLGNSEHQWVIALLAWGLGVAMLLDGKVALNILLIGCTFMWWCALAMSWMGEELGAGAHSPTYQGPVAAVGFVSVIGTCATLSNLDDILSAVSMGCRVVATIVLGLTYGVMVCFRRLVIERREHWLAVFSSLAGALLASSAMCWCIAAVAKPGAGAWLDTLLLLVGGGSVNAAAGRIRGIGLGLAAVLFLVGAGAQLKGLSRQQREILLAIEQHGALMPQVEAELARPPATDVRMAALGDL